MSIKAHFTKIVTKPVLAVFSDHAIWSWKLAFSFPDSYVKLSRIGTVFIDVYSIGD